MKVTEEMLVAAVAKAVEAGLFPRSALKEDRAEARRLMQTVLQQALQSHRQSASGTHSLARPSRNAAAIQVEQTASTQGLPRQVSTENQRHGSPKRCGKKTVPVKANHTGPHSPR